MDGDTRMSTRTGARPMDVRSLYDVSAYLVVLLVLAGFLVRDRRRSRHLLVGAVSPFVGELIIWLAQTQWEEVSASLRIPIGVC
jgi:hypothetical protein